MKIIRNLLITLLALTPPALVVIYYEGKLPWFEPKSTQSENSRTTPAQKYDQTFDAALKVYKQTYDRAFKDYQQEIIAQWGEFKDPGPSVWVSYEQSGNIRRSVDYSSGEVEVEKLIDKEIGIAEVRQEMDKAVFRLMNTTEKTAYESDVVANRVEQKLSRFARVVQQAELTDERLFSMDDLVSIRLNHDGFFKVWFKLPNVAVTDRRSAQVKDKDIVRVSFRVPHSIHEKAVKYAAMVSAAAEKEQISDELIYAIMETESSFNPMAKSPVPAYGLMQIVPHTAGKDATRYLHGKAKILAPSYLFKPENNIAIGAAYLHVLNYQYLRRVTNVDSRRYCAIAAYNTGASNVAKAFIKQASFNRAVSEINKLTSEQVFDKLRKYLPRRESRNYVEKVSRRMQKYL